MMSEHADREPRAFKYWDDGATRAAEGKAIPLDLIFTNFHGKGDHFATEEYQRGYLSVVEDELAGIGVSKPSDIGVAEPFDHVVINSGAGIIGFANGVRVIKKDSTQFEHEDESSRNHYRDGYSIGFAFARALARKGNFTSLAPFGDIAEEQRAVLSEDIRSWLEEKGLKNLTGDIVLNFHPYTRLGFAYRLNYGPGEFDEYLNGLRKKQVSGGVKEDVIGKNIDAAKKGFAFANSRLASPAK